MDAARAPAVAGSFYEAHADRLRQQVEGCFLHRLGPGQWPQVNLQGPRRIRGLISPHAGLMYSGPTAAHGYLHLAQDGQPEVVVILGPNHRAWAAPVALYAHGRWRTPLGTVPIAEEEAAALLERSPLVAHDPRAHALEHSIEVQLPFLQYLYDNAFRLLPISVLDQSFPTMQALGELLAEVLQGVDAVIIASTDLSHYEPPAVAARMDGRVMEFIARMDAAGLVEAVQREGISMCGYGPVAAMLTAAQALGAQECHILHHSSSSDITGPGTPGVGYLSAKVIA